MRERKIKKTITMIRVIINLILDDNNNDDNNFNDGMRIPIHPRLSLKFR